MTSLCGEGRCLEPAPTCTDGRRAATESDVDCGGTCPACEIGRSCAAPKDCLSGSCAAGRCEAAPVITGLAPAIGPSTGGTRVTLSGERLGPGATVTIGGTAATVESQSPTQIIFTTPTHLGMVGRRDLVVKTQSGGSATRRDAFQYYYGQPNFADKVDYGTGDEPRGIQLADLDGDGRLDVVSTHRAAATFTVNLGKGDGTFAAAVPYGNGGLGSTLAIADFSGDGRLDLATVSVTSAGVTLRSGLGNGTFGDLMTTAVTDALRLASGDFNGDGKPDLVIGLRNTSKGVRVLLKGGGDSFAAQALQATTDQVITIATGDLDKDGKLDVVAGVTGSVVVLLGNGDGTLKSPVAYPVGVPTSPPQSFAIADLNGDGLLDVVAGNNATAGLSILLNRGAGVLDTAALIMTPGNNAGGVAAADIDGDGRQDLVVANTNNASISVLFGQGDGTFPDSLRNVTKATSVRPLDVSIGDLDKDGRLDIVVQTDTGDNFNVLRNTSQ